MITVYYHMNVYGRVQDHLLVLNDHELVAELLPMIIHWYYTGSPSGALRDISLDDWVIGTTFDCRVMGDCTT